VNPHPRPLSRERERGEQLDSSSEILDLLSWGDREIAEGFGYELDEVLAEADQLLRG